MPEKSDPTNRLDTKESAYLNYWLNKGAVTLKDFCAAYEKTFRFYPADTTITLLDIDEQGRVTGWTERDDSDMYKKLKEYNSRGFTRNKW